jgi:hypothetical protein
MRKAIHNLIRSWMIVLCEIIAARVTRLFIALNMVGGPTRCQGLAIVASAS